MASQCFNCSGQTKADRQEGLELGGLPFYKTIPDAERGFQHGIAFSGGGARACGFTHGILSELFASDLLRKVDIISTNSGGGWAVMPVGYCSLFPIKPDVPTQSIEELLRRITDDDVKVMTEQVLNSDIPHSSALIGSSSDLNPSGWMLQQQGTYGNRTWTEGIGYGMFEQHNLNPKRYLKTASPLFPSATEARQFVETHACENAFHPRDEFPFMVHLGSVLHYDAKTKKKTALPYDFTPVSSGSYGEEKRIITVHNLFGDKETLIRGRYPTCAFDALKFSPDGQGKFTALLSQANSINYGQEKPFTVHDITGISSCAYASTVFDTLGADMLIPRYVVPNEDFYDPGNVPRFADGANTDNSAILPLVVRGVKHIISVLSNDYNLDEHHRYNGELARLFGLSNDGEHPISETDGFVSVPVFSNAENEYEEILAGLIDSSGRDQRRPAIFTKTLKTIANEKIGLFADQEHEITFVFLAKCQSFVDHIKALNPGIGDNIQRDETFPNYATIGEDIWTHGAVFLYEAHKARKLAMLGQFYVKNDTGSSIKNIIDRWSIQE